MAGMGAGTKPGEDGETPLDLVREHARETVDLTRAIARLRRNLRVARERHDLDGLARTHHQRAQKLERLGGMPAAQARAWVHAATWTAAVAGSETTDLLEIAYRRLITLPIRLQRRTASGLLRESEAMLSTGPAVSTERRCRARAVTLALAQTLGESELARTRIELARDYGRLHDERIAVELIEILGGETAPQPLVFIDTDAVSRPDGAGEVSAPCRFLRPAGRAAALYVAEASHLHDLAAASITRAVTSLTVGEGTIAANTAVSQIVADESIPWPVLGRAVAAGFDACGHRHEAAAWSRIAREPSIDAARRQAVHRTSLQRVSSACIERGRLW